MKTTKAALNFLVFAGLLWLAAPVFGATVSTVTCSAYEEISLGNYISVNNPAATLYTPGGDIPDCIVQPTGPAAAAYASGSSEIGGVLPYQPFYGPAVPAGSTVYGMVSADVRANVVEACGDVACNAGASLSASETITFQTLGPLRPGIAVLYTYVNRDDAGDEAEGGGGVEDVETGVVELGTALSITAYATAYTYGGGYADGSIFFWYVLYEADDVTPVTVLDVAATPEPSTWALTLLPLALLWGVSLRRRHN